MVSPIDYAKLIWDDMIHQASKFQEDDKAKIPFGRVTKLLIAHFMKTIPEIDPRQDDKFHTPAMDQTYSRARILPTSTKKQ